MKKCYVGRYNELHYCEEENKYILFNMNENNWISFDENGKEIYKAIEEYGDLDKVIDVLARLYMITAEEISPDVNEFVNYLRKNKFVFESVNEEKYMETDEKFYDEKYPYNIMMISVSSLCNLDCIYCYNKEMRNKSKKEDIIGKELEVKRFLDDFKRKGGIGVLFTGGEPLLYKSLAELCAYAKTIGLKTKLITNATLLYCTEKLEDILSSVDEISLSLDSFEKKELEILWNIGNVKLENIKKGLERLNNYSKKNKRMNVIITPIVSKINMDSLDKVISCVMELLRDCELKIEPTKYMPIGNECDKILSISEEEYARSYVNACKRNGIVGNKVYASAVTHNGKYYPYPKKDIYLCKPSFFIKPNGDVFPCQNLLADTYFLGNIKTHSFEKINECFLAIMKSCSVVKASECHECTFRFICPYKGGICRKKTSDCKTKLLRTMCVCVE